MRTSRRMEILPKHIASFKHTCSLVYWDEEEPKSINAQVLKAKEMCEREVTGQEWAEARGHMLSSTGDTSLLWCFFSLLNCEDIELFNLAVHRIEVILGKSHARDVFRDLELDPVKIALLELR